MSTMLLIGRMPGVGQPPLHPARRGADLDVLEQHRGVARATASDPRCRRCTCPSIGSPVGLRRRAAAAAALWPVMAATSRATPIIDRQRAMFGNTSISSTMSPMKSASGMPTGASSSRRMMPSCSSSMPSSKAEQTIASLGTPRILRRLELLEQLLGRGMAVEEHRAGQGEDDLLALVADVDVRGAGDECLGAALRRRSTVGSLSLSALGCFSTLDAPGRRRSCRGPRPGPASSGLTRSPPASADR